MQGQGYSVSPEQLIPNNKRVLRFDHNGKKKNAWVIVYENTHTKSGESFFHAVWGDWSVQPGPLGTHTFCGGLKLTREDKLRFAQQTREASAKLDDEKKILQEEAAQVALQRWNGAMKFGLTQYIVTKGLAELYGARLAQDNLLIPAFDCHGKLWSLQTITRDGDKFFQTDGRYDGCFHLIGDPITTEAFICEGFATAATVSQATGKPTVVAFSSGNLPKVAKALAEAHKGAVFTICGDNDEAGIQAAHKAEVCCRGKVVYPTQGKDFNDMMQALGLDAVRELLSESKATSRCEPFVAVGQDDDVFYFYSTETNQIIKIRNFTDVDFYRLADLTYWETLYPPDPNSKGSLASWSRAKNALVAQCKLIGSFDVNRIRGTGVWQDDEGKVVLNLGRKVVVDGAEMNPHEVESSQIYTRSSKILSLGNPLADCSALLTACEAVKWHTPSDALLLAGWLYVSRLAGSLPVRPHIWLTGGSGAGKSTVFERLISPMLGMAQRSYLYYQGNTTEAAIRQEMRDCSLPVIFDEFDSDKHVGSQKTLAGVMGLLRNTWSRTAGKVAKGSISGMSMNYQLAFCACLASIRVRLEQEADANRFSVLELAPHGNCIESRRRLMEAVNNLPNANDLFARAASKTNQLLATYEKLSAYIRMHALNAPRLGDQAGMLLAGAWMLTHDNAVTHDAIPAFVAPFLAEAIDDVPQEDHRECLNWLLSSRVELCESTGTDKLIKDKLTIGDAIRNPVWYHQLMQYGVKVDDDKKLLHVATKWPELEKIYAGTVWSGNWRAALKRLTVNGKVSKKVVWGHRSLRYSTTAIPLDNL